MDVASRPTALVTGASAGIGEALARVVAAHGFDLVLAARREDRLRALARELTERFQVDARVLVADLADPTAPARIFEKCRAGGRRVDLLVNNAGYGLAGGFLDATWEEHARFIQVMMTSAAELTWRFLPSAGHTLYAASKAFLIKLSESVALENRRHGVHVTALCPGFTHTEFHDVSGTRDLVSHLPAWMWMDAERVAREGYDAVMRGQIVYVPGRANRTIALFIRLLPQALMMSIARRQGRRFRKVAP
jgi:hypothetical protein